MKKQEIEKKNKGFTEMFIDETIDEIVKTMHNFKDKTHDELRIARSKTSLWKFMLLSLYQKGFEQGVYVAK